MTPERSSDLLASIDLGSHTARLLIARWEEGRLRSLLRKRAALPGLDQGRADVILAGSGVVMELLNFFHSSEMMVNLTDPLEGALLDYLGVSLGV